MGDLTHFEVLVPVHGGLDTQRDHNIRELFIMLTKFYKSS